MRFMPVPGKAECFGSRLCIDERLLRSGFNKEYQHWKMMQKETIVIVGGWVSRITDLEPPSDKDGIVTAADVGTLDLEGTQLATLSACDTGIGEYKSSEGILGLRRGFVMAGAENLLLTLWPVEDEATAQFMLAFYEAMHAGDNVPRALAEVQRDWLVKLRGLPGRARSSGARKSTTTGKAARSSTGTWRPEAQSTGQQGRLDGLLCL